MANKKNAKNEYSEMTHEQVADNLGMTRMGILNVENRAMEKFKKELKKRKIDYKDLLK